MTTTVQPTGVVLAAAADSGITRLNPSDGLFLRAEHLARMQDYARELALSVGLAGGSGVVYGYQTELSGSTLTVGAGLAIDPSGRPLRSTSGVELDLNKLPPIANNQFLVVQVIQGEPHLSGTENVYGNLCDDPASPATIQPWADEGVIVQVVTDSFNDLDLGGVNPVQRRNRLASHYFERERAAGGPWLVPGADGPSLLRPWSDAVSRPDAAAVPLAVLLRLPKLGWVLDVWTARRDISDSPSPRDLYGRLGLRPRNVFWAQVLQFQTQLTDAIKASISVEGREKQVTLIDEALAAYNALTVKPKKLGQALTDIQEAQSLLVVHGELTDLTKSGFGELPPAGFLPVPDSGQPRQQFYSTLFGKNITIRVCDCAADFALRAVEQAQHLDRIPLGASHLLPTVDVLVPTQAADLPALRTTSYGWAAFVRHREADCGEQVAPTDPVDVYIQVLAPDSNFSTSITDAVSGQLPSDVPPAKISYPIGGWAVPVGDPAHDQLLQRMQGGSGRWAVVGLARTEDRRSLAMVRATLLAVPLTNGLVFTDAPTVHTAVPKDLVNEAIIVVIASSSDVS